MPIYEYRCEKCGDFEQTQRITDPPLDRCPTCRRKIRRLISSTNFQLKGSGWYVTDYARAGKDGVKEPGKDSATSSDSAGTGSETAASDASSSTTKSETKSKSSTKAAKKGDGKAAAAGA